MTSQANDQHCHIFITAQGFIIEMHQTQTMVKIKSKAALTHPIVNELICSNSMISQYCIEWITPQIKHLEGIENNQHLDALVKIPPSL